MKGEPLAMKFFHLIVISLFLLLPPCDPVSTCNPGDCASLLSFSSNITNVGRLLNWTSSTDCREWEGVLCDGVDGRVISISLPSRMLSGQLSSSLMSLSSLSYLNLSYNFFSGNIPDKFFVSLRNLKVFDISYNAFSGNLPSFPDSISSKIALQVVNLSSNNFDGSLYPSSFLQAAWNLSSLNVSNNSFSGIIPSGICSLSRLIRLLDFSSNRFNGGIPFGLGKCSSLQIFSAGINELIGEIPHDIYRIPSLVELSLPINSLTGEIPVIIAKLPNLRRLDLSSNKITGAIPLEIGELKNLEFLLLHINNLTGQLPPSLANCTKLRVLNLRVNSLVGELSAFDFSVFFQLTTIDLGNNEFTGTIPSTLFSCTSLRAVRLANNHLEGQISPEIRSLHSLSYLSLSKNNLSNVTGALQNLAGCRNLRTLILSTNFRDEALPTKKDAIRDHSFSEIKIFAVGGSYLTGEIPEWLIYLRNVEVLDLSFNKLEGAVPSWFGNFSKLFYLDVSNNHLSGEIPPQLAQISALTLDGKLENGSYLPLPLYAAPTNASDKLYNQLSHLPRALYLGNNTLSGAIPSVMGRLRYLHALDLSHNSLAGSIPGELSNLVDLEKLDLSYNEFSGVIPPSLKNLSFLSYFSVAYNHLQGAIPSGGQFDTFPSSSFEGNPGLYTSNQKQPSRSPKSGTGEKNFVGVVVGVCLGTGLIIAATVMLITSRKNVFPGGGNNKMQMETASTTSYSHINFETEKEASMVILFPTSNETDDITPSALLSATGFFDQSNIIGCGGFGLVYKATLPDGTNLAVKKLSGDAALMEREFKAEVEALATARHENLVSLRGYIVHNGIRMLIYPFMENGSLDFWLHEKPDGASRLDWPTRLRIAGGASRGLAYMHHSCEPHIVHRDVKSSNILLDGNFDAHVADFGLARLILPYRSHVTTELVGTLGYIPPEYGQAWVATLRGDVYSFGVVMLELLTRRRPIEVCRGRRELIGWVRQMMSEGREEDVFDPWMREKGFEEDMAKVLRVALLCVSINPYDRPSMCEVVDLLQAVGSPPQRSASIR